MHRGGLYLLMFAAVLFVAACDGPTSVVPAPVGYASDRDVPRISAADAKKEVDAGNAVMVDVRTPDVFRREHIAGAINVTFGQPTEQLAQIAMTKKLIIYCSCNAEHASAAFAFQLGKKGIDNAYAMVGGTSAWKNAGYPME